jgi:hypothetical protein
MMPKIITNKQILLSVCRTTMTIVSIIYIFQTYIYKQHIDPLVWAIMISTWLGNFINWLE